MLIRARFLRALKAVYAHQGELQPLLRRLKLAFFASGLIDY